MTNIDKIIALKNIAQKVGQNNTKPNMASESTVSSGELSECFALTELRGENSVSSSQPIVCVQNRTHQVSQNSPKTQSKHSVSLLFRNSYSQSSIPAQITKSRNSEFRFGPLSLCSDLGESLAIWDPRSEITCDLRFGPLRVHPPPKHLERGQGGHNPVVTTVCPYAKALSEHAPLRTKGTRFVSTYLGSYECL